MYLKIRFFFLQAVIWRSLSPHPPSPHPYHKRVLGVPDQG